MFREMRRAKQALTREENIAVLERGTSGVLAAAGDDDYPYAVPLSFAYDDGKLFFHGAYEGHKIDAIKRNDKVSFCVIDMDDVKPEEHTTYFRSVIVFGRAKVLDDAAEKRAALECLAAKYSPDNEEGRLREIDKLFDRTCVMQVEIDHMSGKESKKLREN